MRFDVKKYLFVGVPDQKALFFQKAQELGLVHFIDPIPEKHKELPQDVEQLIEAIKVLRGLPVMDQEAWEDLSKAAPIFGKILSIKHQLEKLEEEERVLTLEIARIRVFGDFSMSDIDYIRNFGRRHVQFYFAKKVLDPDFLQNENLIYVGSEFGLDYFVGINETPKSYENLVEIRIDKPVGMLQNRLGVVQSSISNLEIELKSYAKYQEYLHRALVDKLNSYHLLNAIDYAEPEMESMLFAVQGWIPENKIDQFKQGIKQFSMHMVEVMIEPDDKVPTYLENEGASKIGEDLVHIYDTPSKDDNDPSLWVLCSFSLFFAMIIGDGGYGLVFLAAALYLKYKFNIPSPLGKRVLNLFLILCVSCILWGALTNQFFGINFSPSHSLKKLSVLHWLAKQKASYHIALQDGTYAEWIHKFPNLNGVTDPQEFLEKGVTIAEGRFSYDILNKFTDNIMMEIAILIGMIHISLSLLRYIKRNWSGIGWIIFIWGGYLYLPEYLDATSMTNYVFGVDRKLAEWEGLYMVIGGLGLSLFLAVLRDRLLGILEITMIIQVFADILSYLRLYALGLAGSIMSTTVNEIASSSIVVFGVLIVIVGHILNMLLSIIGGIIHGLRLNFLEWYHYSFEGGGKQFHPLKKIPLLYKE